MRKTNYANNSVDGPTPLNDWGTYETVGGIVPQFAVSPILNSTRLSLNGTKLPLHEESGDSECEPAGDLIPQFAVSSILNFIRGSKWKPCEAVTADSNDEVPSARSVAHDNVTENNSFHGWKLHPDRGSDDSECESDGDVIPQFAVSSILDLIRSSKSSTCEASNGNDEVPSPRTVVPNDSTQSVENSGTDPDKESDDSECESTRGTLPQFAVSSILNFIRSSKSNGRDASIAVSNGEVPFAGESIGSHLAENDSDHNMTNDSETESVGNAKSRLAISPCLDSIHGSKESSNGASIIDRGGEEVKQSDGEEALPEEEPQNSEHESVRDTVPQFAVSPILNAVRRSKSSACDASTVERNGEVSFTRTPTDRDSSFPSITPETSEKADDESVSRSKLSIPGIAGSPSSSEATSLHLYAGESCLRDVVLLVEELKKENCSLKAENRDCHGRIASLVESVSSLRGKVEELLKQNMELRETCSYYKSLEKVEKGSFGQSRRDSSKKLGTALQSQVDQTEKQFIASKAVSGSVIEVPKDEGSSVKEGPEPPSAGQTASVNNSSNDVFTWDWSSADELVAPYDDYLYYYESD